jgi:hypothetical protein
MTSHFASLHPFHTGPNYDIFPTVTPFSSIHLLEGLPRSLYLVHSAIGPLDGKGPVLFGVLLPAMCLSGHLALTISRACGLE